MVDKEFVNSQKNWDRAIRKAEREKELEKNAVRKAKLDKQNKKK